MAVKIRLQRKGRKKAPFYHIVIADSRSPRDGKFIEKIGSYNPTSRPAVIEIDRDKAFDWLMKGAQPTDTVNAILRYKGVLYRKHLQRGVSKGALTPEKALEMYNSWIAGKESDIQVKVDARKKEIADYHKAVSGEKKEKPVKVEEPAEAPAEEVTETVNTAEATVEEPNPAQEEQTKAEE